jgi:Bax protein
MLKEVCATLLILCNPILNGFDFDYAKDDRDHFVQGVAECTVKYNAFLPPFERAVVVLSVAQAIIESDWGTSRFAREANNFYGVIQTDKTEPHIKSLKGNVLLKTYGNKCESVADYIELLNSSSFFEEYRELRIMQVLTEEVNVFEIIDTLDSYAKDPKYQVKLKDVVNSLLEDYPLIFKMN